MKKAMVLASGVLAASMLAGCAGLGHFTNDAAGAGVWYADTSKGVGLGSGSGSKSGQATAVSYLGLVALGDASIQAAAQSAGITKISHVDRKFWHILGLYGKTTTVVYGD